MKSVKEGVVEKHLREKVKELGGRAYKFVSPGNSGVPDRLVVLPGGKIVFVETKAPGKETTSLQKNQIKRLQDLGCIVHVIDSKARVDAFIEAFIRGSQFH